MFYPHDRDNKTILLEANKSILSVAVVFNKRTPKDKRKEAARQYVNDALAPAGVPITPEADRLIEGAIQSEVLALGHKDKDEIAEKLPENVGEK